MIDWILNHWVDLLAIYGAIVAICSTIVKLTPSVKDDAVWAKILKFLDLFSTAFTKSDKELLEKAVAKTNKK